MGPVPCARTNVVEHARFRQGGEHRCTVQKMAFHEVSLSWVQ